MLVLGAGAVLSIGIPTQTTRMNKVFPKWMRRSVGMDEPDDEKGAISTRGRKLGVAATRIASPPCTSSSIPLTRIVAVLVQRWLLSRAPSPPPAPPQPSAAASRGTHSSTMQPIPPARCNSRPRASSESKQRSLVSGRRQLQCPRG